MPFVILLNPVILSAAKYPYKLSVATQRVARQKSRQKFIFVILSEWNERKIHIVILSVSEISTEIKTHIKFKVKNPRLKGTNLRFDFMDTSLSCESSVWQGFVIASFAKTKHSNPKTHTITNSNPHAKALKFKQHKTHANPKENSTAQTPRNSKTHITQIQPKPHPTQKPPKKSP